MVRAQTNVPARAAPTAAAAGISRAEQTAATKLVGAGRAMRWAMHRRRVFYSRTALPIIHNLHARMHMCRALLGFRWVWGGEWLTEFGFPSWFVGRGTAGVGAISW